MNFCLNFLFELALPSFHTSHLAIFLSDEQCSIPLTLWVLAFVLNWDRVRIHCMLWLTNEQISIQQTLKKNECFILQTFLTYIFTGWDNKILDLLFCLFGFRMFGKELTMFGIVLHFDRSYPEALRVDRIKSWRILLSCPVQC